MGRVMYIEGASGAAGDMILGALLDAGLPEAELRRALGSLGVEHKLRITRVLRAGVSATHVAVGDAEPATGSHAHHHHRGPGGGHPHIHEAPSGHRHHDHGHEPHSHRSLAEITSLINRSALSPAGKARAVALFRRMAEVEAAIHGMSVERVHLHEVGAIDSIIDITGAVFAFEWWGIDDIVASPLNVGSGTVEMAHGRFPVPAPATVRLLAGVPIYSSGADMELVTPTGALLVSDYARAFGPLPAMAVSHVGYGAGTRDRPGVPNVVRLLVGERTAGPLAPPPGGTVVKIECEIDDMNPQLFGPVSDRLFADGALDVFLTPVQMKKGRPGVLLTVLAPPDRRVGLTDLIFRETTTLGVRFGVVERETLDREWIEVTVRDRRVRIKVARRRGAVVNANPEFEDCVAVATGTGTPVKTVQAEALRAWLARNIE